MRVALDLNQGAAGTGLSRDAGESRLLLSEASNKVDNKRSVTRLRFAADWHILLNTICAGALQAQSACRGEGIEVCWRQYWNMRLESGILAVERYKQPTANVSPYRAVKKLKRRGEAAVCHPLFSIFGPKMSVATRFAELAQMSPAADMFRMSILNCFTLTKSILERQSISIRRFQSMSSVCVSITLADPDKKDLSSRIVSIHRVSLCAVLPSKDEHDALQIFCFSFACSFLAFFHQRSLSALQSSTSFPLPFISAEDLY